MPRKELLLGLVAAAAAAGFPAPDATQGMLVCNITVKSSAVSWADIYKELKFLFEEIYCQALVPGSAWDALLQVYAESLYRINCIAVSQSFPDGKGRLYDFMGIGSEFKINRLVNCA